MRCPNSTRSDFTLILPNQPLWVYLELTCSSWGDTSPSRPYLFLPPHPGAAGPECICRSCWAASSSSAGAASPSPPPRTPSPPRDTGGGSWWPAASAGQSADLDRGKESRGGICRFVSKHLNEDFALFPNQKKLKFS